MRFGGRRNLPDEKGKMSKINNRDPRSFNRILYDIPCKVPLSHKRWSSGED